MQLRELLGVLRTRWRTVSACLLLVVGITAGVTMMTPPVYSSSARVYLTIERPRDALRGDPGGTVVMRYNDLKTLAEVLPSPTVMEPLRAALGLPAGAGVRLDALCRHAPISSMPCHGFSGRHPCRGPACERWQRRPE